MARNLKVHKGSHFPDSSRGKGQKPSSGQKGHKGKTLEQVNNPGSIVSHIPDVCTHCHLESKEIEIVEGFKVLARRWVVERTFAWICRNRRMSKDYEFLTQTQENMMLLAMIRTMLRRTEKILNQI